MYYSVASHAYNVRIRLKVTTRTNVLLSLSFDVKRLRLLLFVWWPGHIKNYTCNAGAAAAAIERIRPPCVVCRLFDKHTQVHPPEYHTTTMNLSVCHGTHHFSKRNAVARSIPCVFVPLYEELYARRENRFVLPWDNANLSSFWELFLLLFMGHCTDVTMFGLK